MVPMAETTAGEAAAAMAAVVEKRMMACMSVECRKSQEMGSRRDFSMDIRRVG